MARPATSIDEAARIFIWLRIRGVPFLRRLRFGLRERRHRGAARDLGDRSGRRGVDREDAVGWKRVLRYRRVADACIRRARLAARPAHAEAERAPCGAWRPADQDRRDPSRERKSTD